jgi:DNA primase
VKDSEAIIIVEGRSDVLNLLKAGIKNAIAVEGTNIPKTVQELSRERVATAFVDGDRGGELILRELFQVAEVDFVARAPRAHEVEELTAKQIIKCLRNKVPGDQYMEMNGLVTEEGTLDYEPSAAEERRSERRERYDDDDEEEERRGRKDRKRDRDEERRSERRERYDDDDDDRRERKDRKSRFDNDAIEKFRKKKDESAKAPAMIEAPEEPAMIEAAEVPSLIEAPSEPEKIPEPAEAKPSEPEEKPKARRTLRGKKSSDKVLTAEQTQYRDMLLDLATTHNAKVLGDNNEVIREVAVKNLVNSLKEDSQGVVAIVFDGVISQRILDISAEKGIGTVIGTRRGNVSKMPAEITILTKEDLY